MAHGSGDETECAREQTFAPARTLPHQTKQKNLSTVFEAFQFGYELVRGVELPKCLLDVSLLVSSSERALLLVKRALLRVKRGLLLKQKRALASPLRVKKRLILRSLLV